MEESQFISVFLLNIYSIVNEEDLKFGIIVEPPLSEGEEAGE